MSVLVAVLAFAMTYVIGFAAGFWTGKRQH